MNTVSPFRALEARGRSVRLTLDGLPLMLPEGANLAAALLVHGYHTFRRTPVSGAPRAPFCMMGACFDCLVEINGVTRQACMVEVSEGLRIARPGFDRKEEN